LGPGLGEINFGHTGGVGLTKAMPRLSPVAMKA